MDGSIVPCYYYYYVSLNVCVYVLFVFCIFCLIKNGTGDAGIWFLFYDILVKI